MYFHNVPALTCDCEVLTIPSVNLEMQRYLEEHKIEQGVQNIQIENISFIMMEVTV